MKKLLLDNLFSNIKSIFCDYLLTAPTLDKDQTLTFDSEPFHQAMVALVTFR